MNNLIISFITADRPGIVKTLSDLITQHKGNWKKSSLHQMSGVFAGVIEISVPVDNSQALSDKLVGLTGFKMQVELVQHHDSTPATLLVLELTANDRVGIVQEISSIIHQHGGNLLKLVSTQESAPHSGHELFKAKVTITADEKEVDTMIDALENLADDLMVDISR
ncbi:amino acid-binding protein [Colwellia sp. Arc7-635]|uniref:glycine cleavage system protein R n=1 Tax=Colwellia sp. Arc7-635 TaxID=2497879 RepID=UPI000F8501C9|nr:ACT domain-containing protein [Colwellia sp. Arc7-635]AZQ85256.1 amino acid-binding protein [Colwellia sp. Arc7-635]